MRRLKLRLETPDYVKKYGDSICWLDILYRAVYDNSGTCNRCVFDDTDITHNCKACNTSTGLTYVWIIDTSF